MINRNNSNLTLPTVRLVFGILAIVLSLIFSIEFVSHGMTGAAVISAIIFCVITEFCKTIFCGDLIYYWETGDGSKTLFSAIIVIILFALSISAAVFVLTISPVKVETTIAAADSKQAQLESALTAKQTALAQCPPTFVTKCKAPLNAEINALQIQLTAVMAENESLADAKADRLFWEKAAGYLGTNADTLQFNFALARAVLLDLLGLILVSQYTAAKRIKHDLNAVYSHEIPQNKPDSLAANDAVLLENMRLLKEIELLKNQQQTTQQTAVDLKKD